MVVYHQPHCAPTLTLSRPFSLVHENGQPGYNSRRPCGQDGLHARHRLSWSADNTTLTAGRMRLIAGRNPDGNGKPVAKIRSRRSRKIFEFVTRQLHCLVASTMIRTERRPIVLGTFDYYREQVALRLVKRVRLLRLVVVVVKLAVETTTVVVVVKPLVGRRQLLLRRWR